jgi:hypothetical protein
MALTTEGREWYIDKVQDVATLTNAKMTAIGWGTGVTAEAVGDVGLVTEATEARVVGTLSQPTSTTDRLVGTMTCAGALKNITEVGRFNTTNKSETAGNTYLLQRHLFTAIPTDVGDSITFTLDVLD